MLQSTYTVQSCIIHVITITPRITFNVNPTGTDMPVYYGYNVLCINILVICDELDFLNG